MSSEIDRENVRKARALRKNMTKAEIILWSRIRSRRINGFKFRRQHPIFEYIVDFYCDELKLIIEVDGEIHSLKHIENHDKKREKILNINGYHVIRLTNFQIITDLDSSILKIKSFINTHLSPSQGDLQGVI